MPNNNKIIVFIAAAVVTLIAFLPPANAAQIDTSNPAFAAVGDTTSIPIGAAAFCKKNRADCAPNATVVDGVELTPDLWGQLLAINADVNARVAPITDADQYQVEEYWTYPQTAGDCEDYALEKRRTLINGGWDPSVLMIAVVRQQSGAGHAVLMVRTDRGDLVLDNQDGMVLVWTETPYQYIKRQSQANPGQWVDIVDNRGIAVAAN